MKLKNLFFIWIFSIYFCACSQHRTVYKEDKERIYNFIDSYIKKVSQYPEYKELQRAFNCFYVNAVHCKRQNYLPNEVQKGEEFIGLDSLIIFSVTRDTALLFYIEKNRTNNDYGFYFYIPTIIAYKTLKGWRFYDRCAGSIYSEKKNTLDMARRNERLGYVFENYANDIHWLENWWSDREMYENPLFIRNSLRVLCGLCLEKEWEFYEDSTCYKAIIKATPPDSLYECK